MQSLLLLLSILPNQLDSETAKNPNETNDETLRASVAAAAKEFAGRCEFHVGGSGDTKLVLHPEPILHWTNPTVGKAFGEVYVWTHNGRPAVVGSWYRWFSPDWGRTFETTSLAEGRVTGRVGDVRFWDSEKSGLTLKPLANAVVPAKTPSARLAQMRRLAGDFVVHLADTRGGNRSEVKRQLRMLTQPVFRYPAADANTTYLDGALFAFVEGTDPEAFLLLEAVKTNDAARWHFGLARMNGDALRVTFRDMDVWSVPTIANLNLSKEPYAFFSSDQIPLEPTVNGKEVQQ
jgi:hypothetical protein